MSGVLSLPKPGDVLVGRYVLQERIGEGGMGIVYRAEQPALARTVAIKLLHPELVSDAVLTRRFKDEARAAGRIRHSGTVAILDCDVTADGAPFIVMQHVPGRPLGRIIAEQEQPLPLPRVLAIAEQILRSLEATHACGVIHADIKSDNFLVDAKPEGDKVTMIDFGLAMIDGAWINSGFVSGTPEYMAPEVIQGGPPTIASDLYGVGVILYEMLTGAAPFTGASSQEILASQLDDEVIPPSLRQPDREIPSVLDGIVLRALHKDPRERFASAAELAAALRGAVKACDAAVRACGALAEAASRSCRSHGAGARPELRRTGSESPTRNCGAPRRRRFTCRPTGAPRRDAPRRDIASARPRGDAAAIADGYVERAARLAREQRIGAAIRELEEGVDVLTAGHGPPGDDAPEPVRRLVAALAALRRRAYDRVH
ncbi:MAG TPA: serine/threonine-protein kinase [Kofleriaceae bacterium]|nr:serine/threonine-protein kinase [Kofleriaceae bacterium]